MPSPVSSPAPIIALSHVTKTYAIWDHPSARFWAPVRRMLGRAPDPRQKFFTAVKDVNLEILPGECVGIIGRNGAGKSTLLQMIAGTVPPTAGSVAVRGRVAALLELGSGFSPDFTGRENVHMNASILGLSRAEIAKKYDAIVEYSGVEEFIDQPVRTYSSGMVLRLAFAVCVHVDADILIIDEALAVGDARFQFKCHLTLEQLRQEGRTIIFVSHDTNAVKRMCRSAVLLERGEMLLNGEPNEVTNIYTKLITSPHGVEAIRDDLRQAKMRPALATAVPAESPSAPPAAALQSSLAGDSPGNHLLAEERAHQQVSDKEYSYGGEKGRIAEVTVTDATDAPRLAFVTGTELRIKIVCEARAEIAEPIYALTVKDVRGQEVYGSNTYFLNQRPADLRPGQRVEVRFFLPLNIQPGAYFISLGWVRLVNAEVEVIHRRYDVLRIDVLPRDRSFGLAWCPMTISVGAPRDPR